MYVWAQEQGDESRVVPAYKFERQDVLIPWKLPQEGDGMSEPQVVRRYCHMFKRGELEKLCESTGCVEVLRSCYEMSNWGVVLRRVL